MISQLPVVSLLAPFLLVLTFALTSAEPWNLATLTESCGNVAPPTYLCDPESLLYESDGSVTDQLAAVNNNTEGVIYWKFVYYYGYVIAAVVVDEVEQEESEDSLASVTQFGKAVQRTWFAGRECDNSTLVLASLNTSRVLIFPGKASDLRLRTHHKDVCDKLRVNLGNVTEGVIQCVNAIDDALKDALKPYANAAWGYGGAVAIMTMLLFHYWIKY